MKSPKTEPDGRRHTYDYATVARGKNRLETDQKRQNWNQNENNKRDEYSERKAPSERSINKSFDYYQENQGRSPMNRPMGNEDNQQGVNREPYRQIDERRENYDYHYDSRSDYSKYDNDRRESFGHYDNRGRGNRYNYDRRRGPEYVPNKRSYPFEQGRGHYNYNHNGRHNREYDPSPRETEYYDENDKKSRDSYRQPHEREYYPVEREHGYRGYPRRRGNNHRGNFHRGERPYYRH